MSIATAFRYELKQVEMVDQQSKSVIGLLNYGDLYRAIIVAVTDKGITADDIVKVMDALQPLKDATKAGDKSMILDKDSYSLFKEKLAAFRFGIANEYIADFIKYVRALPVVELKAE